VVAENPPFRTCNREPNSRFFFRKRRVGLVARGWNKKIWGFQKELIFTRDKRNPLVEQLRLAACPAFTGWPRPPPTALVGPGPNLNGNFDPRRITDYLRIRGLAGVEGIFEGTWISPDSGFATEKTLLTNHHLLDNNIEAIVTAALTNNLRFLKQLRYLEASAYVPRPVIDEIRAKYPTNQLSIVERLQTTPIITPGAPTRVIAAGSISARSKLLPMLRLNLDGEGRRTALQLAHEVDHDELALALLDVARRPRSKLLSPLLDVYASLYSAHKIHTLRNTDGVTLLMLAVQSGAEYNFNQVLKIVSEAIGVEATRSWLDEGDVWGNTALHYACTLSSGPIVATLLASGADSNVRSTCFSSTHLEISSF
jgi:ankyrin repeat protein